MILWGELLLSPILQTRDSSSAWLGSDHNMHQVCTSCSLTACKSSVKYYLSRETFDGHFTLA